MSSSAQRLIIDHASMTTNRPMTTTETAVNASR